MTECDCLRSKCTIEEMTMRWWWWLMLENGFWWDGFDGSRRNKIESGQDVKSFPLPLS